MCSWCYWESKFRSCVAWLPARVNALSVIEMWQIPFIKQLEKRWYLIVGLIYVRLPNTTWFWAARKTHYLIVGNPILQPNLFVHHKIHAGLNTTIDLLTKKPCWKLYNAWYSILSWSEPRSMRNDKKFYFSRIPSSDLLCCDPTFIPWE